jgi:hypothetical protein
MPLPLDPDAANVDEKAGAKKPASKRKRPATTP